MRSFQTFLLIAALGCSAAGSAGPRKLSFQTWHTDEEQVTEDEGHGEHKHGKHHNCIHDELLEAVGSGVQESASHWVTYETVPHTEGRSLQATYQPIRIAVNVERMQAGS